MIYIVGFTFQFNPQTRPQASGLSVQEQILLSKRGGQKTSSAFDSRFMKGMKYRISRIQSIHEAEESKVRYLFENLSFPGSTDIDILLPDTTAGDEYVAAISSNAQQLEEIRKQITSSRESY